MYTINYLIVPKPSTELVIGVPYFFLCIWALGFRWKKLQHKLASAPVEIHWPTRLESPSVGWLQASHGLKPGH